MNFLNLSNKLKKIEKKIIAILNIFMFSLLLFMVSIVFINVVSRYFLSTSFRWIVELSRAVFVWLAFIGITVVMWEKGHIGLGNIFRKLNPILTKLIAIIGIILQIIFIYYLFSGGLKLFLLTLVQLTPTMRIPYAYIYIIVPIMAFLMIITCIKDIFFIFRKDKKGNR